jgi:protein phosphatase
MAELDIAHAATIGARAEQQDAATVAWLDAGRTAALVVVADGLGGHAHGALASRIVIETFDEAANSGRFADPAGRRQALADAIHLTNQRIHEAADPSDGSRSLGSTAVAAIIANGTVRWISVGDSHLYVCRHRRLIKLNADHSEAGFLIRQGYAPDDEAVLRGGSILLSALSGKEIEEIDDPQHTIALEAGDVVLLASDGLDTLGSSAIGLIIDQAFEHGAEAIAAALIENIEARGQPRQDNATVVVARVLAAGNRDAEGREDASAEGLPLPRASTTLSPVPPADTRSSGSAAMLLPQDLVRPLDAHGIPAPISPRRRQISLKILLALLCLAAITSVIVTQTGCCGLP